MEGMMSHEWEAHYQSGDIPWDKGSASPPLVKWLQSHSITGRVLVPGCGSGHDVRALAAQGADVIGLDVAPSAIQMAQSFPPVRGEQYITGDLFALTPGLQGSFDWIVEHTCFCAIPPTRRSDYVRSVHAALRSGGRMLAVFYIDPGWDTPSEGPPFGVTRHELLEFFGATFRWVNDFVPDVAFDGREGRELIAVLEKTSEKTSTP